MIWGPFNWLVCLSLFALGVLFLKQGKLEHRQWYLHNVCADDDKCPGFLTKYGHPLTVWNTWTNHCDSIYMTTWQYNKKTWSKSAAPLKPIIVFDENKWCLSVVVLINIRDLFKIWFHYAIVHLNYHFLRLIDHNNLRSTLFKYSSYFNNKNNLRSAEWEWTQAYVVQTDF